MSVFGNLSASSPSSGNILRPPTPLASNASDSSTSLKTYPKDLRVQFDKALDFSGPMLCIEAGEAPNIETFSVHQSLLTSRSAFFERELKTNPGKEKFSFLDRSDIFKRYINLAYTEQIATMSSFGTSEYMLMTELYLLAKRLGDYKAKNSVVSGILIKSRTESASSLSSLPSLPSMDTVKHLYEGTEEGNKARKLFVDLWVDHASSSLLSDSKTAPLEFLHDLSTKLFDQRVPRALPATGDYALYFEYKVGDGQSAAKAPGTPKRQPNMSLFQ